MTNQEIFDAFFEEFSQKPRPEFWQYYAARRAKKCTEVLYTLGVLEKLSCYLNQDFEIRPLEVLSASPVDFFALVLPSGDVFPFVRNSQKHNMENDVFLNLGYDPEVLRNLGYHLSSFGYVPEVVITVPVGFSASQHFKSVFKEDGIILERILMKNEFKKKTAPQSPQKKI